MKNFIDKAISAAKSYHWWDFAALKLTLISGGIILGAYLSRFFMQYISIMWAVFAVTFILIIYQTFIRYWDKK